MIHAYNECYLDDAMRNLGEALEFAEIKCNLPMDDFMSMFIASGYASQFEAGVPNVIAGLSGTELTLKVLGASGMELNSVAPIIAYDYSPEYWCGWILAYYQWRSAKSFSDIHSVLKISRLKENYSTLHEASEEKCYEVLTLLTKPHVHITRLQKMRKNVNLTQNALALKSGISLRTLQEYENRSKNINRAAGETLFALSRVLGCKIEDLLEH